MERTPWMTATGAIFLAIAGGLGAASQVIPKESWRAWLLAASIFLGSAGGSLMGRGIRRNIPTLRTPGRIESIAEAKEGVNGKPC